MLTPLKTLFARTKAARKAPAPSLRGTWWILPNARDRWISAGVAEYTPDRVEVVIRGAMAGDLTQQWVLFDLMERTWPRLAKNLAELKGCAQTHEWALQPWSPKGGKPSQEAMRRAALVEEAIWSMEPDVTRDENDFQDTLRDLADAWGKGVSVVECDWQPRPASGGGTIMAPRSTRWVHPRHYGWPNPGGLDAEDRLMLRTRELTPAGREAIQAREEWVPFPPDRYLIAIAKARTGHPCGAALLQVLGFWWAAVNFGAEWFLNYVQLFGVPMRWATYDTAAPQATLDKLEAMLEQMGSSAWGMFPAGTQLELKEAARGAGDNPHVALEEFADKQCDLVILGQTLTSEVSSTGGSYAASKTHAGVLADRKAALIAWLARVLNAQLVRSLCRLNFGDTRECPYFLGGEEEREDAKALAETFEIAARTGVQIPAQFAHDSLGIPMPQQGEPVLEPRSGGTGMGGLDGSGLPSRPGLGLGLAGWHGRYPIQVRAKSAQDRLADAVLEDVTGVQAEWLGGARQWFRRLIEAAEDPNVSDREFLAILARARNAVPDELGPLLKPDVVAESLEAAMGAAVVNGAISGYLRRKPRRDSRGGETPAAGGAHDGEGGRIP